MIHQGIILVFLRYIVAIFKMTQNSVEKKTIAYGAKIVTIRFTDII